MTVKGVLFCIFALASIGYGGYQLIDPTTHAAAGSGCCPPGGNVCAPGYDCVFSGTNCNDVDHGKCTAE
jgi:hypothetical protein